MQALASGDIHVKDGDLHVDPPPGGDVIVNGVPVLKRIKFLEDEVRDMQAWRAELVQVIADLKSTTTTTTATTTTATTKTTKTKTTTTTTQTTVTQTTVTTTTTKTTVTELFNYKFVKGAKSLVGTHIRIGGPQSRSVTNQATGHQSAYMTPGIKGSGVVYWKTKITGMSGVWVMLGVLGSSANAKGVSSYGDSTNFGWSSNQVYKGADVGNNDYGGWGTWKNEDEAAFMLDLSHARLVMKHKRQRKRFTLTGLQAKGPWHIHMNLHAQSTVEVSPLTESQWNAFY